jgi:hypothetical protein
MKKKKGNGGAKMYVRMMQKHWRKHGFPSPSQQAEAKAKIDATIADLKAKAAELPALRAEYERLQDKLRTEQHRIATLAAQFHVAYEVDMDEAVELAIKQTQAVRKKFSVRGITAPAEKKEAPAQADIGMGYQEFVSYVTSLKKWDQALGRFKEFLLAVEFKPKPGSDNPDTWLAAKFPTYRTRGSKRLLRKQADAEPLKRRLTAWWKKEKRARAQRGGKARAKQRKIAEKLAKSKRICPECGKRELEPKKRLCRYCGIRAKVSGVGYLQDKIDITELSDRVQAALPGGTVIERQSGKTPRRKGE